MNGFCMHKAPSRFFGIVAGCLTLLVVHGLPAQMCKWVDEEGCVHYAEQCPDDVDGQDIQLQPDPSEAQAAEAEACFEQAREAMASKQTERKTEASAPGHDTIPAQGAITMSPEDVDCPKARLTAYVRKMEQECERARERQIAPLRQEAIDRCVKVENKDRKSCENFYADYMNPTYAGRRVDPRPFDFLPECVIARTCAEEAGMELRNPRRKP